jgi:hypothetical protein
VIEVAGHRHHHVARAVVELEEGADPLRGHLGDRVLGAEHLATQRVPGEQAGRALLGRLVRGLVGVHEDLVQDDLALGIEIEGPQRRPPHDVGQDVEAQRHVLGQEADVERGVLLGGEGVEVASHLVHRLGDGGGRPVVGPLEQEVLEEVGSAGQLAVLVARPRTDPEADAHRSGILHPLGDQ